MSRFVKSCVVLTFLLLSGYSWADGAKAHEATPAELKQAQVLFRSGSKLFDASKYSEAITAFRASHDVVASPNSSLMVARCLLELGRLLDAHAEFRVALTEAETAAQHDKKYAATAEAVKSELAEAEQRLGRVQIRLKNAPPGTEVRVGTVAVSGDELGAPTLVAPGEVTVQATAPDGTEASESVTVGEGDTVTVELGFAPASALPSSPEPAAEVRADTNEGEFPLRTLAYVAGGVGVIGVASFAIFGSMSNSKYSELRDACENDLCLPERRDDVDDGKRFQTFANIGLAVGVIGVGAGVTLFFLSAPSSSSSARADPAVIVGPGSVALKGRF